MEEQGKYGLISIIFSIIAIIISWNKNYLLVSIVFGSIAITFAYLSFYIKQIKENSKNIENIKKDLDFEKRLINIENILNISKRGKMDKKGLSDTDILDIIKIGALIILGYIILKTLSTNIPT